MQFDITYEDLLFMLYRREPMLSEHPFSSLEVGKVKINHPKFDEDYITIEVFIPGEEV